MSAPRTDEGGGSGGPSEAPLVQLEHVEVRYGAQVALRDLSLVLQPGRTGLLGPSGAGKSSLLKLLLGLVSPAHGLSRVLGHDVATEATRLRAEVGYMPEGDSVLADLTALEATRLAAELSGLPRAEATARAHEILSYVGLGEARYRALSGFSTGMRQRARLAQALVSAPKLLLLDEPTSGLDPQGRAEMLALIEDIPRRTGASVILSTHILPDVERTCEHVVVLAHGEAKYAGSLSELLASERRRFELRVKREPERLASLLRAQGFDVELNLSALSVRVPEGADSRTLLTIAVEHGFQVRHLAPLTFTLEQAFRATVAEEPRV